jgi:hypothetical protein
MYNHNVNNLQTLRKMITKKRKMKMEEKLGHEVRLKIQKEILQYRRKVRRNLG